MPMPQTIKQPSRIQARLPVFEIHGRFDKSSINMEERTVDMTFTTSTPVRSWRWKGWDIEQFNEILSMDPAHIRLERFQSGAPLLNNHSRYNLRDQIGVIVKHWFEGEKMRGRVRFSKRADADEIFKDVEDGIIVNASIGYKVHKYKDESKEGDTVKTLRAIDWEPMEVSLVPVGADPNAGVRAVQEIYECEIEIENINERTEEMPPAENNTPAPAAATQRTEEQIRQEEREKNQKIYRACRQARLGEKFAEELVASGKSLEKCLLEIQEKWAESDQNSPINPVTATTAGSRGELDEVNTRREGMAEAIMHRAKPNEVTLTEKSLKFRGRSSMELVRMILELNGIRTDGRSQDELIERAMHSTSDFPAVFENIASKRMQKAYESVTQVFKVFSEETTLKDFKQASIVQLGEAPALKLLGEGAEITYGTMGDSKEVWALLTYAKAIALSRQMIINDDMGAFTKVADAFGRQAAILENELAMNNNYLANPAMGDGNALFHTNKHGNLAAAGAYISKDTVSALKALMRKQKNDKSQPLELAPRWLLVGPDSESTAREILANTTAQGGFNVHGNQFELLVSSQITDYQHHVIADKGAIEGHTHAYLEGARGLQQRTLIDPKVLGITIQAYMDFAAKAVNWRAFAKNPGAAPA